MKKIKPVSIWDKGTTHQAEILNAHAVMVSLGTIATFYYQLLSQTSGLQAQLNDFSTFVGNITVKYKLLE
jgi:ABC-type anion transport system duplicated permease subunit